jgi:hypothetical protein
VAIFGALADRVETDYHHRMHLLCTRLA